MSECLPFVSLARQAFDVLVSEYGFQLYREQTFPNFRCFSVWYAKPRVFVGIAHDGTKEQQGFSEARVLVGEIAANGTWSEGYDLLKCLNGAGPAAARPRGIRSVKEMDIELQRLKGLLLASCQAFLGGDGSLVVPARNQTQEFTLDDNWILWFAKDPVRWHKLMAREALEKKDYRSAVGLLESILAYLTPPEVEQYKITRKQALHTPDGESEAIELDEDDRELPRRVPKRSKGV